MNSNTPRNYIPRRTAPIEQEAEESIPAGDAFVGRIEDDGLYVRGGRPVLHLALPASTTTLLLLHLS